MKLNLNWLIFYFFLYFFLYKLITLLNVCWGEGGTVRPLCSLVFIIPSGYETWEAFSEDLVTNVRHSRGHKYTQYSLVPDGHVPFLVLKWLINCPRLIDKLKESKLHWPHEVGREYLFFYTLACVLERLWYGTRSAKVHCIKNQGGGVKLLQSKGTTKAALAVTIGFIISTAEIWTICGCTTVREKSEKTNRKRKKKKSFHL